MNIMTFPTGIYGANTYFVCNNDTHECIIIDPGGSFDLIEKMVTKHTLKVKHVLLTHGHFDHIGALNNIRDSYGADVYAHSECSRAIFDPTVNLSAYGAMGIEEQVKCEPAENILTDGQEINLCDMRIKAIHSPGHSKGSMVYIIENCAFTGDVLFKRSIGRTDLYGSDSQEMALTLKKLKKIILPQMKILPGHGEESYMSKELENNRFLINI